MNKVKSMKQQAASNDNFGKWLKKMPALHKGKPAGAGL